MQVFYVDELNLSAVFWIIRRRKLCAGVYYFDRPRFCRLYFPMLHALFLRTMPVRPMEFFLGDLRSETGRGLFETVFGSDLSELCTEIAKTSFSRDVLTGYFSDRFGKPEIHLHLKKKIQPTLMTYNAFIHAIAAHARTQPAMETHANVFLLSHFFSRELARAAGRQGVHVETYAHPVHALRRWTRILARFIWPVLSVRGLVARRAPGGKGRPAGPILAANFNGKRVSFDPSIRSDFFWAIPPVVPRSRVMICFNRSDHPVTADMVESMMAENMEFVALSPRARRDCRVPIHRPGPRSALMILKWNVRIAGLVIRSLARGKPVSGFYLDQFIDFVRHYARWVEFVERYGVKIHVDIDDFSIDTIPFHLAVKSTGGVTVGYQFSVHNFAAILLAVCRDVYFAFGPYYLDVLRGMESVVGRLVFCGYITDQAFPLVRDRSRQHRERLMSAGAKFVVCFFDENSWANRLFPISNRRTEDLYRKFLTAVMEDPALGLIIKPGYPRTLFQRLPNIRSLADQARATGRCLFLDEGTVVTDLLPTEAAQAADVTVGFLFTGTAAMEAILSGCRTVYLDLESVHDRPEYRWSPRVVYETWEDLWKALDQYRRDPSAQPDFGRIFPTMSQEDPFQDGRAAVRIAEYLEGLLEKFKEGKSRDEALASASSKYAGRWGEAAIVSGFGFPAGSKEGVQHAHEENADVRFERAAPL
ncbi:MAG: hypothetical protein A3G34_14170 [Candidatus Lindowbacteria bacterium RIFCSPLOWO2_12_FULL_62_27]|nr:MAG: hypothetical protein A3I06_15845 [Candidatus Lindowbacteria bacterium RIFCSPLOWO2_02_FULL_62_12]OGH62712.1 MAG: hypothetical protein A3G34_14170 [Candidatus Lindowbacteria bacterium RIFCSPLOWO2_12_FULL_62_27]